MARRRTRTRTVYRTARRYGGRARGGGGSMKPIIDGAMAGAGATLIKRFVNVPYADDLALLGVGYFRKNTTLKTLGAMGLAADLLAGFGGGNKNSGGSTY